MSRILYEKALQILYFAKDCDNCSHFGCNGNTDMQSCIVAVLKQAQKEIEQEFNLSKNNQTIDK